MSGNIKSNATIRVNLCQNSHERHNYGLHLDDIYVHVHVQIHPTCTLYLLPYMYIIAHDATCILLYRVCRCGVSACGLAATYTYREVPHYARKVPQLYMNVTNIIRSMQGCWETRMNCQTHSQQAIVYRLGRGKYIKFEDTCTVYMYCTVQYCTVCTVPIRWWIHISVINKHDRNLTEHANVCKCAIIVQNVLDIRRV